ncbi:hypothetical protein ACJ72_03028 [Emergomyces africanus]|uniref:Uncharacterized protein n=1 Tax=Emergomyces africanus TaxID=1955775 RepID=A0A1B7P0S4_9EURO|nr:hypothetical protein ACJ72_03028 [Emergomyces africanus]
MGIVQFSQGFVESLQASSETDSSRAQTIELHIQNRIAAELERIRARETQTLADLEKRIADQSSPSSSRQSQSKSQPGPLPPSPSMPRVYYCKRHTNTGTEQRAGAAGNLGAERQVGREEEGAGLG